MRFLRFCRFIFASFSVIFASFGFFARQIHLPPPKALGEPIHFLAKHTAKGFFALFCTVFSFAP